MPYRQKKRRPANSSRHGNSIRNARFEHLDQILAQILADIAQLLVKQGYSYGQLSKLAKVAFVNAAKTVLAKSNTRGNIAGIATLTGLTRLEVSKLLIQEHPMDSQEKGMNRAMRVASGWANDREFIGRNQKPRQLRYSTSGGSFQQLVRKYSGDIPARAMLSEMSRLGIVSADARGIVTLKKLESANVLSTFSAMRAIAPWVKLVAESEHPLTASNSDAQRLTITFNTLSEVLAASREMKARWRAFLLGLRQLGSASASRNAYDLTVTAALATAKPRRRTVK
jgi:hypothetical protein